MSVLVSAPVWLIPFTPPAKKLVAICIADASDEHGVSWPSLATIAKRCVISKDSAKQYVAQLEKDGWLRREPRFRPDGSQSSNNLRFNIAKLEAESKRYRKEMVREATEAMSSNGEVRDGLEAEIAVAPPGEPIPPTGGCQCPWGGGTHSPHGGGSIPRLEPSVEPSVEPSGRKEERTSALPPPSIPIAQGEVKARRNGRSAPASPEAKAIIQGFAEVYRARFRSAYVPDPRADVTAATFFVDAGVTVEQVASTFEAATRSKGFWASKATTLPVLFRRWNEIQAELAGPAKAQPAGRQGPQPDGRPETDGEAWAREIMEEQP